MISYLPGNYRKKTACSFFNYNVGNNKGGGKAASNCENLSEFYAFVLLIFIFEHPKTDCCISPHKILFYRVIPDACLVL